MAPSDLEDAEQCLEYIRTNQVPYFGDDGDLFRGIKESHGVLYALANYLAQSDQDSLNCLEIGSFAGASALTWAWCGETLFNRSASVTCLDLWDNLDFDTTDPENSQYTQAYMAKIQDIFLANVKYSEYGKVVQHHKMGVTEYHQANPDQKFNLIYVDGDHAFESVSQDIIVATEMLDTYGILCGDDLSLQANEVDIDALESAVAAKQQFIQDPKTGVNYHPGVTAAVWKSFGEVSKYGATWFMQKSSVGWQSIDLAGVEVKFPPHYPK